MNLRPISIAMLFVYFGTISTHIAGDVSVNCGSNGASAARNGRYWVGDVRPNSSLLQIYGKSTTAAVANELASNDPVPHKTTRISRSRFSYTFQVDPGQKIIRLHFNPSSYKGFRGLKDFFSVQSGRFTLLSNFSASLASIALGVNTLTKEFCLNIRENQRLTITFSPENSQNSANSYAFINGIEILLVPPALSYFDGGDVGLQVVGDKSMIYVDHNTGLEIVQRRNVKQESVSSSGDSVILFPKWATHEADKKKSSSWNVSVDVGFRYLVRLHFSELGLKIAGTGDLMFEVLINNIIAQTSSDIVKAKDARYDILYRDYTVMVSGLKTDGKRDILISIVSYDELREGLGVVAGFEVVKLSNPDNSLASPNPLPPPQDSPSRSFGWLLWLLGHRNASATVGVVILSVINVILHMLRDVWKERSTEEETKPSALAERIFRRFSLAEIQSATKDFNDLIGKGGFGKVYKGLIDNGGHAVAVKRLKSSSNQGAHEFLTEIETLSALRHINLVSLIGYCRERREMILVYEYMPNRTLADHLYKIARANGNCSSLTWKQRLNICIEAGRGLDYLHTGQRIIHRDVKASNILLDENFVAKVSDFGLAKPEDRSRFQSHVSTKVKGTFGYLDPYYLSTQKLTRKSDTYAFGVVLLEVLCERPAVDSGVLQEERILTKWALDKITKGEVDQIAASNLREQISPSSLKTFVQVAERCLQDEPENRPTMAQVVIQLELALEQQESKLPLVLNEIHMASAEIEESVNTGWQPTMAINDLQNVTHPPEDKPNIKVVDPELPSEREVGRKSAKHKQSRFWPLGLLRNRAHISKGNGLLLSDWNTVAAATSSVDMVERGELTRMYKATLSTKQVQMKLKNEDLLLPNLQHYIYVNDKRLSTEELVLLQSCPNPPKKLRPGRYWYDKVSGFWGKEGRKPSQLISPLLAVGYMVRPDASSGDTNIMINGRIITKAELWMLQAAGVNCDGNPHFWVTADGSCQQEGMNNVIARLWKRKLVRVLCAALSLPFPSSTDKVNAVNLKESKMNRLLLVGCNQAGTSTIFKQAKILYDVPFTEGEKENYKCIIQKNLFRYICILLENHQHLEEDHAIEIRGQCADQPGPSGLEAYSKQLVQYMTSVNLELFRFPAVVRKFSTLIEQLWKDNTFQAIYRRRNQLPMLPRIANYFLDRALEISRADYEPSEMDIIYSEGIASNEVESMEFAFPTGIEDFYEDLPLVSYQLSRVHASSLGGNCKLLDKFRDVDLVICCVSLTDYAEDYKDVDGLSTNKMLENKKLFEKIVTHPTLADKHFLLILNKLDLLEEIIEKVPLSECIWFRDFNPVIACDFMMGDYCPSLVKSAFCYVGWKFKRTFRFLTGRKLFVTRATALDAASVDEALRYGNEILKWENDVHNFTMSSDSSDNSETF